MIERSSTDPEISRQLCSSGMVDYLILLRLKEGKVTSYLLLVMKRNKKEGAVLAAETRGDEGGAGSQQAATRLAQASWLF